MRRQFSIWSLGLFLMVGCASSLSLQPRSLAAAKAGSDTSWLEDIEGEKALNWVRAENSRTQKLLEADSRFGLFRDQIEKIISAKDRIPFAWMQGQHLYNFWRDDRNVRGVLRRASFASYLSGKPRWQTVLDLDRLAKKESENWIWGGIECLPNQETRCLISLSRGGKDADVVREFDLSRNEFVGDGFAVPEAKSSVEWWSKDEVLIGTDFGPNSLTKAGYPRQVRIWKRGMKLQDLPLLFEGKETDVSASSHAIVTATDRQLFIDRRIDFYTSETFWVSPTFNELRKVPLPPDAELLTIHRGQAIISTRTPWRSLQAGDVAAFSLDLWLKTGEIGPIQILFRASPSQAYLSLSSTKSGVLISYLDNVQSRMQLLTYNEDRWSMSPVALPDGVTVSVAAASPFRDDLMLRSESFLSPTQLLYGPSASVPQRVIMQTPERFSAKGLTVEQHWATSADGTKIPYFEIGSGSSKAPLPTLLTAYGGFEVSQTPYYSGSVGKAWLERGGRYVVANIRGGGEFGPKWHQAVVKENRPKVFEDFIAVAEDLIRRGRTSAKQLGISGGSNGGLLVSATMVKRPDLFGAVVCQVPLTDMLNYNQWLAGSSWMGEYGDPSDPKMREVLLSYSPLHNLKPDVTYPEILLVTSTKDDRVHPAHARKFGFRLQEFGKPFLYFENIEGGHGAAANLKQYAYRGALEYVYLSKKLGLK